MNFFTPIENLSNNAGVKYPILGEVCSRLINFGQPVYRVKPSNEPNPKQIEVYRAVYEEKIDKLTQDQLSVKISLVEKCIKILLTGIILVDSYSVSPLFLLIPTIIIAANAFFRFSNVPFVVSSNEKCLEEVNTAEQNVPFVDCSNEKCLEEINTDVRINEKFEKSLEEWVIKEQKSSWWLERSAKIREAADKIKEAFYNNSETLSLKSLSLETLPPCIDQLSQLKNLCLACNDFTSGPIGIGKLANLKKLDLSLNELTSLPMEICELLNLEELVLYYNKLNDLPKEVGNLAKLKVLKLENNKISRLPSAIGQLQELKELDLSDNELIDLPKEIGRLPFLTDLSLQNNKLTCLPEELGDLPNLYRIDLRGNKDLVELPISLGQISTLGLIEIDDTKIDPETSERILNACQVLRYHSAKETFPKRLLAWQAYSGKKFDLNKVNNFKDSEKKILNEWLFKLDKTRDFSGRRQELAKAACGMLESALKHPEFKLYLIKEAQANNRDCEDRAALSFNDIYTFWKICTLSKDASLKEKLDLLIRASKTQALRIYISEKIATHEKMNGKKEGESLEILLYWETLLKEQLLTAIREMSHEEIGDRHWIKFADVVAAVEENYPIHLMEFEIFQTIATEQDILLKGWEKIRGEYSIKQVELSEVLPEKEDFKILEEYQKVSEEWEQKALDLKLDEIKAKAKVVYDWIPEMMK